MRVVQLPSGHARRCEQCGAAFAPAMLACPECGRLVHAAELARLASVAGEAERTGQVVEALAAWRQVLDLLPPDAGQAATVRQQITALGKVTGKRPPQRKGWAKGAAAVGVVGAALSKLKFLLLGLTKAGTLLSMLATISLRGSFGWQLAIGIVLSIYIHEMGHVATLQRFGFAATPPMFVPGVGAFVLLRQHPVNPHEDARIGLAGPIWGLGAAVATYAIYLATGTPIWGQIARAGAYINFFNLIPVWQLDGGRAFRALVRRDRWIVAAVAGALVFATRARLLLVTALVVFAAAAYAAAFRPAPDDEDRFITWQYAGLLLVLWVLTRIPVPLPS